MSKRLEAVVQPPDSCVVATPSGLSRAIVQAIFPAGNDAVWLDPCVGDGAFVRAFSDAGIARERILALDISSAPGAGDSLARTHRGTDFVSWALDHRDSVDRVATNPPYVGLDRLDPTLRKAVSELARRTDCRVDGRGNYWLPFLIGAVHVLRRGGSLGLVLPAAFEYADYALTARSLVAKSFEDVRVIRSGRPLFKGVKDGCVVLIAQARTSTPASPIRVRSARVAGLPEVIEILGSPSASPDVKKLPSLSNARTVTPFSTVARIRIGAVTGDAAFFLLTDPERVAAGIPLDAVKPILSHASDLTHAVISNQAWSHHRDLGKRCWLFSPTNLDEPLVRAYAERSPDDGGCRRSGWVKKRDPWYRVEFPTNVHAVVSGMTKTGPRLTLIQKRDLTATNTLYVVEFLEAGSLADRAAWSISFMSRETQEQLESRSRSYPDGLRKLEPTALSAVDVPRPRTSVGALSALEVVWNLYATDPERSTAMASTWCRTGHLSPGVRSRDLDSRGTCRATQTIADSSSLLRVAHRGDQSERQA